MTKHARILFTIAALFNLAVAVSLLLTWPLTQELLQLTPAEGSNALLKNVAGVIVLAFGYAYWLISRDPVAYRPYISLGAIAKTLVFIVALPVLIAGGEGALLAAAAVGDLLFAVLFFHFLLRHPAAA